jgi:hypothetical protein
LRCTASARNNRTKPRKAAQIALASRIVARAKRLHIPAQRLREEEDPIEEAQIIQRIPQRQWPREFGGEVEFGYRRKVGHSKSKKPHAKAQSIAKIAKKILAFFAFLCGFA